MRNVVTRNRLMLLLVFAAMAALTLAIYSSLAQRGAAQSHARQEIGNLARVAAEQQAQIIEEAKQMLIGFSLIPSSIRDDRLQCGQYVEQLLKKSPRQYIAMGLNGAGGEVYCSGTTRERSAQPIVETGKFSIGEYQATAANKLEGLTLSHPITETRGVTRLAFVTIDLAEFEKVAAKLPISTAGLVMVLDRNGIVLARNPRRIELIGQKLESASVIEKLAGGKNGVFYDNGADGSPQLFAYENVVDDPTDSAALRVLLSIPTSVIHAQANETLVRNLVAAVFLTLLLLVGSWYGAEFFFMRNVRTLLETAQRVRGGDLGARTGMRYGNDELSKIGKAFDEMADALQERQKGIERAMHNLHQQAITDSLTSLHNRRYLYELLPRELVRAKRNSTAMSVVIIDLDHFKRVNDTSGHEAGDLVLREVGGLLMKSVRGSDIVCRYGGEEFCLVLPDAPLATTLAKADDIRLALERLHINYCGKSLRMTASLGIAVYPQHGADSDALLRAADEALYEAKAAGRNRVAVYNKESVTVQARMSAAPGSDRGAAVAQVATDTTSAGVSDITSIAARRGHTPPLRTVDNVSKPERVAALQFLTGTTIGEEVPLVNKVTTVGQQGGEIAVINRTSQGYFITHIEGPKYPIVNGSTIESRARYLHDRDVVEIAGVKMVFFYK